MLVKCSFEVKTCTEKEPFDEIQSTDTLQTIQICFILNIFKTSD